MMKVQVCKLLREVNVNQWTMMNMRDLIQDVFLVALGMLTMLAIVLGYVAIRRARRMQKRLNDYMRAMDALSEANTEVQKKKRHLWIVPALMAPIAILRNHPVAMGVIAAGSICTLLLVAPMVTDESIPSKPPPPIAAEVPAIDDISPPIQSSIIETPTVKAQDTKPSKSADITLRLSEPVERSPLPTSLPLEPAKLLPIPAPTTLPQSQTRLLPLQLQAKFPLPFQLLVHLQIGEGQSDGVVRSTR